MRKLLLSACFDSPEKAIQAWSLYCQHVDLAVLDHPTTLLLPLVYHNLKETNATSLAICKSLYRHTWSFNHLKLVNTQKLKTVVPIRDASLVLNHYRDVGLRRLQNLDFFGSKLDVLEAAHHLKSEGWSLFEKATGVACTKVDASLFLHWSLPLEEHFIDPEGHLLSILFYGQKYTPYPSIQWIADAVMIVRTTPHLNWELLKTRIHDLKLTLLIYQGLILLKPYCHIPNPLITQIETYTPHFWEKSYVAFWTTVPKWGFKLRSHWYAHIRSAPSHHFISLLLSFLRWIPNKLGQKLYASK